MATLHSDRAHLGAHRVVNATTYTSPHTFSVQRNGGGDGQAHLRPKFIEITGRSENVLEFDMVGTSAPVANALRRAMLDHVATVAIEEVIMNRNTGVLQDEVLSLRLGLLPIRVDTSKLGFPQTDLWRNEASSCLKFTLKAGNPGARPDSKTEICVYSGDLVWEPLPGQREIFGDDAPRLVHDKVLLTKLAGCDYIDLVCYAKKGTGATHAKFSPVAPAWYRMLPIVEFKDINGRQTVVEGEDAKWLKKICPGNVFDIEDTVAVAARPRNCTACRECVRGKLSDHIYLGRQKDHFIWTIESTGVFEPEDIVRQGMEWLKFHCLDNAAQVRQSAVKQQGGEVAAAAAAAF